jgi:hypothetical protein
VKYRKLRPESEEWGVGIDSAVGDVDASQELEERIEWYLVCTYLTGRELWRGKCGGCAEMWKTV